MSLLVLLPAGTLPGLAPIVPATTAPVDTFRPDSVVEDRGHFNADVSTLANDSEWRSGVRPLHKVLAEEGTDSYLRATGTWDNRPDLTVKLAKALRPHLGGGDFRLRIQHRLVGSLLVNPQICLVDHAVRGKDWPNRVDGAGRFDRDCGASWVHPTSEWAWEEIVLDHDMVHGWQGGGIENFGDLGLKLVPPAGPEAEWQIAEVQMLMNPAHPGEGETAHWGVRPPSRSAPGQGWAVVDYDAPPRATQTIQVGREFYTSVADGTAIAGLPLDGSISGNRVLAICDAARRAHYDNPSPGGSGYTIVEIEEMVPFHQAGGESHDAVTFNGAIVNNTPSARNGIKWLSSASYDPTTGAVTGVGEYVKVDKLVIRSAVRTSTETTPHDIWGVTYPNSGDRRAHINCADGFSWTPYVGGALVDTGHIACVGLRLYRTGNNMCVESGFDKCSDEYLSGWYDCHFTGANTYAGGTREFKSAIRGSYCGYDVMDCRSGVSVEHFLYHGGSRVQPCQFLRSGNMASTSFYPSHPNPNTEFNALVPNPVIGGNVRAGFHGRTIHQSVHRTNPLNGSGEGTQGGGDTLDEDSWGYNAGNDGADFTAYTHLGNYTNRRCWTQSPNTQGTPPIALNDDAGNGQQTPVPKGFWTNFGQFDGTRAEFFNAPGNAGLPIPTFVPEPYPECGSTWSHGDVLIQDFALGVPTAGASVGTIPIRFSGCRSITIENGSYGGYRTPTFADMPHGTANTWVSGGGVGPFHSLAFTLVGFGATPSTYTGWADNSPGAAKIRFGNPASTINPARIAGAGVSASNADLADSSYPPSVPDEYLAIDDLGFPSTAWPPWPQTNGNNVLDFPSGRVYPGMRLPVINSPSTKVASNVPSLPGRSSSIPWPANNNFLPLALQFALDAPTVGGGTSGIAHASATLTCSSSIVANGYGEGTASATATLACSSSISATSTTTNVARASATLACSSSLSALLYDAGGGSGGRESFFAPTAGRAAVAGSAAGRLVQSGSMAGRAVNV